MNYYPPVGFHFVVKIVDSIAGINAEIQINNASVKGSISVGIKESEIDNSFQEVSGISYSIETEAVNEGGENRFTYQLPKGIKYDPLVLKRGIAVKSSSLVAWCKETTEKFFAKVKTKIVVVSLLDEKHNTLMSWQFIDAYPTKYKVSAFNAEKSEIVIEEIELAYKRFE